MEKEYYLKEVKAGYRDADSMAESRAFYADFWRDTLSINANRYLYDKEHRFHYGGETILSFNTAVNCLFRCLEIYNGKNIPKGKGETIDAMENSGELADNTIRMLRKFHKLHHCLANFMPLVIATQPTLNQAKGRSGGGYYDFPDKFLEDIGECYKNGFQGELFGNEINKEYFENKFGSMKKFVELNYLQDFFEDEKYEKLKKLKPQGKCPWNSGAAKSLSETERKEAIKELELFFEKAISIIENRAARLALVTG